MEKKLWTLMIDFWPHIVTSDRILASILLLEYLEWEKHIFGEKYDCHRFRLKCRLFGYFPHCVQWQLLHVEKDDQVIRHNNNKTWETKEKSIRKAFLFKTLVKNWLRGCVRHLRIVPRKNICFVLLARSCFHYSCAYYFLARVSSIKLLSTAACQFHMSNGQNGSLIDWGFP
jgi:hypothetical protein